MPPETPEERERAIAAAMVAWSKAHAEVEKAETARMDALRRLSFAEQGLAAVGFTDWASLEASLSITDNESNRNIFDYESTTFGGGIGFQLKF